MGSEESKLEQGEIARNNYTHICIFFMLLIHVFVLTDANEATYSIEFGSNFSL